MQFITAAMIAKHVPPNAKRVLEYGVGQGRNLYYYPKGTGMVVGVDPDAKEDLLIQVGAVYSHRHHVYMVYWYTKHPGPIVYSHQPQLRAP